MKENSIEWCFEVTLFGCNFRKIIENQSQIIQNFEVDLVSEVLAILFQTFVVILYNDALLTNIKNRFSDEAV